MPHLDIGQELTVHWEWGESTIAVSHPPGVDPLRVVREAIASAEVQLTKLRVAEERLAAERED